MKLLCSRQNISTHTLTWSVTNNSIHRIFTHKFQLTRSRGAWQLILSVLCCNVKFQLTRSRGAWRKPQPYLQTLTNFNSHAHVERDPIAYLKKSLSINFNSHAHVERDNTSINNFTNFCISTHTLTWSVTWLFVTGRVVFTISTHTLTWSVTGEQISGAPQGFNFNSHAHVERDV